MLRKKYLASLAVAGVASLSIISGAQADGYEPAGKAMAAPVAAYAWGGLYIGVGVGGAQFDNGVGVDASKSKEKEVCTEYPEYASSSSSSDCLKWEPYVPDYSSYSGRGPYETHKSAQFGNDEWKPFGTLQIGYDRMMGNRFFAGVFGDVDFYWDAENNFSMPWTKHHDVPVATADGGDGYYKVGSIDGHIDLERIWNVGVRGGFLVAPHWAIYGGGGYSRAELDGSMNVTFKNHHHGNSNFNDDNGGPTVLSVSASDQDGYFLEGGTEFKMHRNVSLKLAYRYQDLDGFSGSASKVKNGKPYSYCPKTAVATCVPTMEKRWVKRFTEKASFDAEIHSIRATLVIGLNPMPQAVVPLK